MKNLMNSLINRRKKRHRTQSINLKPRRMEIIYSLCPKIARISLEPLMDRPEFEKLLKQIRFKDVIVCHDLTRFGRSQIHILQVIQELRLKQAGLITLKERIDTREDNPYSDLISIFSATAEFERRMIKERQREGIEIVNKKGKYKSGTIQYHRNAKGKDKVIYDKITQMLTREESVIDIHRVTGVARNTIYRIKRELESVNNGVPVQVDAKVEKIAKIRMRLRIENNNKFVRGKGTVRKSIEQYLTYYYKMEIIANEYIIYVPYTTIDEFKKAVYDILGELDSEADMRNCFIEADTYCDELGLTW